MGRKEHLEQSKMRVTIAIVVISDSRTLNTDESGKVAADILRKKGHSVAEQLIVGNDRDAIAGALSGLTRRADIDAILTIGGTGIGKRDITVDALSPLMEKRLEGFGEMFRMMSYKEIRTGALMSRATAGVMGGKVVMCLPGSPEAIRLAIKRIIIPEIGHMVHEATR
jgi:molybdenum cofactor biosynthesis protein B